MYVAYILHNAKVYIEPKITIIIIKLNLGLKGIKVVLNFIVVK